MKNQNDDASETQSAGSRNLEPAPAPSPKAQSGLAGGLPLQQQRITFAPVTTQHLISDGELEQLADLRKGPVVELFWGALGAFLGALPPALEKLPKLGNSLDPIELIDLVVIGICLVAFCVTVLMGIFWYRREGATKPLISAIRERKSIRSRL